MPAWTPAHFRLRRSSTPTRLTRNHPWASSCSKFDRLNVDVVVMFYSVIFTENSYSSSFVCGIFTIVGRDVLCGLAGHVAVDKRVVARVVRRRAIDSFARFICLKRKNFLIKGTFLQYFCNMLLVTFVGVGLASGLAGTAAHACIVVIESGRGVGGVADGGVAWHMMHTVAVMSMVVIVMVMQVRTRMKTARLDTTVCSVRVGCCAVCTRCRSRCCWTSHRSSCCCCCRGCGC